MKQRYKLLFICLTLFSLPGAAQSYTVNAIPYQVYTADATSLTTADDIFSPAVTIGFPFTFYGNTYDQLVVGTNGVVSFNVANAGLFCQWSFSAFVPNAGLPANAIFGVYEDLNNTTNVGSITSAVVGTAPYRKWVLTFDTQPHFQCSTTFSSSQIILYETLNIIDVQIIDRTACTGWNGGRGICGIQNNSGTNGYTAPGRNTGNWTAQHEGWRFSPGDSASGYNYTVCGTGGLGCFDLSLPAGALNAGDPSLVNFYLTLADAEAQANPLLPNFCNTEANYQEIYAQTPGGIQPVHLRVVDCGLDYDDDTVATADEDLNGNGNLADDDTDMDGIPNFADNDDDGDLVLTNYEYVFAGRSAATVNLIDTDNDGVANYLDNDDDGDGVLTINEDYNGNHDPQDDDINSNGIPDYLDETALAVDAHDATRFSVYPNPVGNVLHLSGIENGSVEIYSVTGKLVKTADTKDISVADLQSGLYLIRVTADGKTHTAKFIKQ